MSFRTLNLTDDLHAYVVAHNPNTDEVAAALIEETRRVLPDNAGMQIAPEQAGLMTMLTRLVGATVAVEVGTFTGYSALSIARGLADGGKLICFDISTEFTDIARRYWERAGIADRIELRIGPAQERLAELPADPVVDIAFIDADKSSYPKYWDELVPRVRPGGLLVIDNVLRHGRVLNPESVDDQVIVDFNTMVRADPRVDSILLPVADGITIARVR
jgi:caffeoyl-CoA O-methyltransferase